MDSNLKWYSADHSSNSFLPFNYYYFKSLRLLCLAPGPQTEPYLSLISPYNFKIESQGQCVHKGNLGNCSGSSPWRGIQGTTVPCHPTARCPFLMPKQNAGPCLGKKLLLRRSYKSLSVYKDELNVHTVQFRSQPQKKEVRGFSPPTLWSFTNQNWSPLTLVSILRGREDNFWYLIIFFKKKPEMHLKRFLKKILNDSGSLVLISETE